MSGSVIVEGPSLGMGGVCKKILSDLPDWFGIEEANKNYVEMSDQLPTFDEPTGNSVFVTFDYARIQRLLVLFFRVDDFDQALDRARSLVAMLEEEPDVNPSTGTREFALRDPDGYYVMVSAMSAA